MVFSVRPMILPIRDHRRKNMKNIGFSFSSGICTLVMQNQPDYDILNYSIVQKKYKL